MAEIGKHVDCITAMVTFECEKDQQDKICSLVKAYISDFISHQEGLLSCHLHKSMCGERVVNYAQWRSMEHFLAFGEKAKQRPELPKLLEFKPRAVFYQIDLSVDGPALV